DVEGAPQTERGVEHLRVDVGARVGARLARVGDAERHAEIVAGTLGHVLQAERRLVVDRVEAVVAARTDRDVELLPGRLSARRVRARAGRAGERAREEQSEARSHGSGSGGDYR